MRFLCDIVGSTGSKDPNRPRPDEFHFTAFDRSVKLLFIRCKLLKCADARSGADNADQVPVLHLFIDEFLERPARVGRTLK